MDDLVWVWIDDPNPIYRRGLGCCLRAPGFAVAGYSSGFRPEPNLGYADVIVLNLGRRKLRPKEAPAPRLGIVRTTDLQETAAGGSCTVLSRADLTAESFLASLRSLTGRFDVPVPTRPTGVAGLRSALAPRLSPPQVEVLRLLSQGMSFRDIALVLEVPEPAVRRIVRELVVRLRCRNPVSAVALAVRRGVI